MNALPSQVTICLHLFENHVLDFLIFTESKKNGLAQTLVARQFTEPDLTYQTRFHPVAEPHLRSGNPLGPFASTRKRQIYKRTERPFYLLEPGIEPLKKSRY